MQSKNLEDEHVAANQGWRHVQVKLLASETLREEHELLEVDQEWNGQCKLLPFSKNSIEEIRDLMLSGNFNFVKRIISIWSRIDRMRRIKKNNWYQGRVHLVLKILNPPMRISIFSIGFALLKINKSESSEVGSGLLWFPQGYSSRKTYIFPNKSKCLFTIGGTIRIFPNFIAI